MSIFGTIAIDIFCVRYPSVQQLFLILPQTIGPLFPFTQYNILNSLLIPVSIYIAIAVVVTIFVFPRTAHHAFLGAVTLLLGQMKVLLDAQEDLLTSAPGSISPGSPKVLRWRATRVSMFTTHQGRTSMSFCVINRA
jgi:Putative ER transporter, 6TM, N-terminal